MNYNQDPIGLALAAYQQGNRDGIIRVFSDQCDEDTIPVSYFFRRHSEMPLLEQEALNHCSGTILDVGAGAGCHAKILQEKFTVKAIDTSAGAVSLMQKQGIAAEQKTIFDLKGESFDTILLLMNGIGLAGNMERLPEFLKQLKSLLSDSGKIICDSTDISYLFMEEDGSFVIDLNANYYGEMQFNMHYEQVESGWFDWIYIDLDNLTDQAEKAGLKTRLLFEGENNHYLVSLEHL